MSETVTIPTKIFGRWARIGICGSSGTGKSVIVHKIIKNSAVLFERKTDLVLYFYLVKNDDHFQKLREEVGEIEFHQGLDDLEQVLETHRETAKSKGILLVIEDLQMDGFNSKTLASVFTAFCHHFPLTGVLFTMQHPFQKGAKYSTIINRNLTHYIFSASPRLKSSLLILGRELDPSSPLTLLRVFEHATREGGFPYLMVDLGAREDSFFGGIIPGEDLCVYRYNESERRRVKGGGRDGPC